MNKIEFVNNWLNRGWKVAGPDDWQFKEEREIRGRLAKVYDVSFLDPSGKTGVSEVAVLNEGETNEEGRNIESVRHIGDIEQDLKPFEVSLREWLDNKEKTMNAVFAISVEKVNILDEVAEVMVYTNSTDDVSKAHYVVKRRNNLFSFKKIL